MSVIECSCAFILLFVSTTISQNYYEENILNDQFIYPPSISTEPEKLKRDSKSNLTLACSDDCEFEELRGHFKWQFKACSPDSRNLPCEKYYEDAYQYGNRDHWTKVHVKHSKINKCPCDLHIFNASWRNNGIYRLIIDNKANRVYEVIISDTLNDEDRPSKIVINPKNITIPTSTELVLRCSVKNPSSIMWFKETDANGYDIMYDGHYYSKLSTTIYPNHFLESTEYQSKLSIHKVGHSDSGVYVCVGVNEDSIKTEVNIVTVIGYNGWEAHTSFSLLFLIPLAFALVPITAWLCYYRKKRKDNSRNIEEQRKKSMLISRNLPTTNTV